MREEAEDGTEYWRSADDTSITTYTKPVSTQFTSLEIKFYLSYIVLTKKPRFARAA